MTGHRSRRAALPASLHDVRPGGILSRLRLDGRSLHGPAIALVLWASTASASAVAEARSGDGGETAWPPTSDALEACIVAEERSAAMGLDCIGREARRCLGIAQREPIVHAEKCYEPEVAAWARLVSRYFHERPQGERGQADRRSPEGLARLIASSPATMPRSTMVAIHMGARMRSPVCWTRRAGGPLRCARCGATLMPTRAGSVIRYCLLLAPFLLATPVAADGSPRHREGFRGAWASDAHCRWPDIFMFVYDRRTVDMPEGSLAESSLGCRIISVSGRRPEWRLRLSCQMRYRPEFAKRRFEVRQVLKQSPTTTRWSSRPSPFSTTPHNATRPATAVG